MNFKFRSEAMFLTGKKKKIHTKFVGAKYRTKKSNDALNTAIEPTVKYSSRTII